MREKFKVLLMKEIYVQTIIKNIDARLYELINHVICSICQEVLNKPVTTPCHHSFCSNCIEKVISSKDSIKCPLCKQSISKISLQNDKALWTLSKIFQELSNAYLQDVSDLLSSKGESIENLIKNSKLLQISESMGSNKSENKLSKMYKTDGLGQSSASGKRSKPKCEIGVTKFALSNYSEKSKQKQNVQNVIESKEKRVLECHEQEKNKVMKTNVTLPSNSTVEDAADFINKKIVEENINLVQAVSTDSVVNEFEKKKFELNKNKNNTSIKRHASKQLSDNSYFKNKDKNELAMKKFERLASNSFKKLTSERQEISQRECESLENSNGLFESHSSSQISFSDIINLTSSDALELESGIENFLKHSENNKKQNRSFKKIEKKNNYSKSTNLLSLLKEIIEDNVLYSRNPPKKPLKLPENLTSQFYQNSPTYQNEVISFKESHFNKASEIFEPQQMFQNLTGFGSQNELPQQKILNKIIAKIEKEIKSEELNDVVERQNEKRISSVSMAPSINSKNESILDKNENFKSQDQNFVIFNLLGKINKNKSKFIIFIKLGRFTPAVRRTRSSVVKLVFPSGLASLVKKHSKLQNRERSMQSTLFSLNKHSCLCHKKKLSDKCHSEEFNAKRTPQKTNSYKNNKMSNPSVEIQTTQKHEMIELGMQTEISFSPKLNLTKAVQQWQLTENPTNQPVLASADVKIGEPPNSANFTRSSIGNQTSPHLIEKHFNDYLIHDQNFLNFTIPPPTVKNFENSISKFSLLANSSSSNMRKRKRFSNKVKKNQLNSNKKMKNNDFCEKENFIQCTSTQLNENGQEKESNTHDFAINCQSAEFEDSHKSKNKNYYSLHDMPNTSTGLFDVDDTETESNQNKNRSIHSKIMCSENAKKFEKNEEKCIMLDTNIKIDECGTNMKTVVVSEKLENIERDLIQSETEMSVNELSENCDDTDSDFFVEQTPPKAKYSLIEECWQAKNRSDIESDKENVEMQKIKLNFKKTLIGENAVKETEYSIGQKEEENKVLDGKGVRGNTENSCQKKHPHEEFLLEASDQVEASAYDDGKKMLKMKKDEEKGSFDGRESSKRESAAGKTVAEAWKKLDREESRKKPKLLNVKHICVVASSVKNPEIVKKFTSEFKLEYSNKACREMTHLIVGLHENDDGEVLPLCTPKLLFAMANKKWVISEAWAEESLKKKMILEEENFETCDPVGGSGCRDARLSTEHLFKNCQICLLGDFESISKEELADLILDSGGILISKPEKFSNFSHKVRMIIVDKDCFKMNAKDLQGLRKKFQTVVLSRDYIIMSIQSYKLSSFLPYLMHPASVNNLIEMGYPADLVSQNDGEDLEIFD